MALLKRMVFAPECKQMRQAPPGGATVVVDNHQHQRATLVCLDLDLPRKTLQNLPTKLVQYNKNCGANNPRQRQIAVSLHCRSVVRMRSKMTLKNASGFRYVRSAHTGYHWKEYHCSSAWSGCPPQRLSWVGHERRPSHAPSAHRASKELALLTPDHLHALVLPKKKKTRSPCGHVHLAGTWSTGRPHTPPTKSLRAAGVNVAIEFTLESRKMNSEHALTVSHRFPQSRRLPTQGRTEGMEPSSRPHHPP